MGSAVNYSIVLTQKDFTKQIYENMTSNFGLDCTLTGFLLKLKMKVWICSCVTKINWRMALLCHCLMLLLWAKKKWGKTANHSGGSEQVDWSFIHLIQCCLHRLAEGLQEEYLLYLLVIPACVLECKM